MRMMTMMLAGAMLAANAPAPVSPQAGASEAAQASPFTFRKVMVAMRDGTKLETVIMTPKNQRGPLPILFQRTPYGVPQEALPAGFADRYRSLVDDGYIFVFQSMRGRYGSEGEFTFSTAVHAERSQDDRRGDRRL